MNKVLFIGNLTRDPEEVTTQSGIAYCKFSIAVQRKYTQPAGERTVDYFDCTAWRQTAEFCSKYLVKGVKVAIEGRIETNEYTASDGTKRKSFNIVVDNLELLTKAQKDEQKSQNTDAGLTPVDEDDLPF